MSQLLVSEATWKRIWIIPSLGTFMVTLPTAQTMDSAFPGNPLLHKPGGCDSSFTTDRRWSQKTSEHRGVSGEDAGFPWPSVPSIQGPSAARSCRPSPGEVALAPCCGIPFCSAQSDALLTPAVTKKILTPRCSAMLKFMASDHADMGGRP